MIIYTPETKYVTEKNDIIGERNLRPHKKKIDQLLLTVAWWLDTRWSSSIVVIGHWFLRSSGSTVIGRWLSRCVVIGRWLSRCTGGTVVIGCWLSRWSGSTIVIGRWLSRSSGSTVMIGHWLSSRSLINDAAAAEPRTATDSNINVTSPVSFIRRRSSTLRRR